MNGNNGNGSDNEEKIDSGTNRKIYENYEPEKSELDDNDPPSEDSDSENTE